MTGSTAHQPPQRMTRRSVGDLQPGDHLCWLFSSEDEHRAFLTPFLRTGLDQGQKVLCLSSPGMVDRPEQYLREAGLEVGPYLESGQLVLRSSEQTYTAGGVFDSDRMVALLRSETERAVSEGYPALRVAGDVGWLADHRPDVERFIAYEKEVNRFFATHPCLAVCQYDRRRFAPDFLVDVLVAHPLIVLDSDVLVNCLHVPPQNLPEPEAAEAKLNRWIENLKELRRMEDALRDSEVRYRQLVETIPHGIQEVDRDGCLRFTNRAHQKLCGFGPDETTGMAIWDLVDGDQAKANLRDYFMSQKDLQPTPTPWFTRYLTKDGRLVDVKVDWDYKRDDQGELTGFVAVVTDITTTRIAEEALRASEEKYRTVVDYASVAILVEQNGFIQYANPKAEQLSGYSTDELSRLPWAMFLCPEDRSALLKQYSERRRGQIAPEESQYRIVTKSGHVLWVESTALAVNWAGLPSTLVFLHDISQRRQAEEALRQASDELEQRVTQRTVELVVANEKLKRESEERRLAVEMLHRGEAIIRTVDAAAERFLRARALTPEGFQDVLTRLGEAAQVSRTYLFENHEAEDGTLLCSQRFEWAAPGVTPQIDNPLLQATMYDSAGMARWRHILERGHLLQGHVKDFPQGERDLLEPQGIKSILVVPIFVSGSWWGFIGFDECAAERKWSAVEIDAFRAAVTTLSALIERQRVETALRESEERYRQLVEHAPVALAISVDGRIVFVNRTAERIADATDYETLIGKSLVDVVAPEDRATSKRRLRELLEQNRKISPMEYVIRKSDGSPIVLEALTIPYRYEGKPAVLTMARDVTQRVRFEAALRASEAHLASLMETATNFVVFRVTANPNHPFGLEIVFVSPSIREIIGVSDPMAFQAWFDAVHPDDLGRFKAAMKEALTSLRFDEKFRVRHPDGVNWRWIRAVTTVLKDDVGAIRFANGILLDITDQIKAEEAVKESEEHLRSLMENAVDFVVYRLAYNPDSPFWARVVFVSPSIQRIIGVSDPSRFDTWFEAIHADDRDRILEANERGVESGKLNEEFRIVHPITGEMRWIQAISTAFFDAQGRPMYANGILLDVTDRRQAEAALRESEARYRHIINHAPAGIYEIDFLDGRFVSVNDVMCEYTGYSKTELLSMRAADILTEESRQRFQEHLNCYVTGQPLSGVAEFQIRTKNGDEFWAMLTIKAIWKNGRVKGATVVAHNITERKRAEQELRESEKKYRELIEGLNEAVFRLTVPDGVCEYVSPAAQDVFGFSAREIMAMPHKIPWVIHPDFIQDAEEQRHRLLKGEVPPVFEYKIVDPNGEERWILQSNKGIYDRDGRLVALEAICRNVTEKKRADEQLLVYQERLRRMSSELELAEERERRRIAMDLHDDIGQSLAISKLKLKALRQTVSAAAKVSASIDEVLDLIEQMIRVTRSLTLQLSPPILYELGLEAAVEWLAEQVQDRHGIEMRVESDGRPKPMDPDLRISLFRAVRELLMNVVKHAGASRAHIALRHENGHIYLAVQDNGVGFVPVQPSASDNDIRGFGLFSIQERLNSWGGRLMIESKPGRGTRVTLYAPLESVQRHEGGDDT